MQLHVTVEILYLYVGSSINVIYYSVENLTNILMEKWILYTGYFKFYILQFIKINYKIIKINYKIKYVIKDWFLMDLKYFYIENMTKEKNQYA